MLSKTELQSIRERAEKATDAELAGYVRQEIFALLEHVEAMEAMPGVRSCACREIPGLLEKIKQLEQRVVIAEQARDSAVNELKQRAERAEKAVAEMRECMNLAFNRPGALKRFCKLRDRYKAAMNTNSGQTYLSPAEVRELVKPMVESLQFYAECVDGCTCGDGWDHTSAVHALKHAREKGWCD